jgi:hypothetical protein
MLSDSPVKMRVSALHPTCQLNPSKRALGTILAQSISRQYSWKSALCSQVSARRTSGQEPLE